MNEKRVYAIDGAINHIYVMCKSLYGVRSYLKVFVIMENQNGSDVAAFEYTSFKE